jgi:hypothetical protein
MLHTHSFIYHQRCIMFLSQYFSFPCQYHSTNAPYSFIYMLLLPEEQTGEPWEPSNKIFLFSKMGEHWKKNTFHLVFFAGLLPRIQNASSDWAFCSTFPVVFLVPVPNSWLLLKSHVVLHTSHAVLPAVSNYHNAANRAQNSAHFPTL